MDLILLVIFPLLTAIAVLFCRDDKAVKGVSLAGSIVQLGLSAALLWAYMAERAGGNHEQFIFRYTRDWYPSLGIQYSVGVDGISVSMILLTAVITLAGVLVSWKVKEQAKQFFFMLLMLSAGAYGFFTSLDLFTMFFFLELAVMPKFLLIGIWGSGKKEYSAMKLALMLMGGSALVLSGMLGLYWIAGKTFSIDAIAHANVPIEYQRVLFPLMFAGFGVFTAMFPFHSWAPDGHSSAPTAASMFLAGTSMKLGGYGCIRAAVYLMPQAAHEYSGMIITAAVIAILYGAFVTMMQKDLKYINAYSSVSHCGFVLLGIGMMTQTSVLGAVLQMISHGVMTALFFAAIGFLYERTHTREVDKLGGLLKAMPFLSSAFIIAGLCSLGLPGFSGFVAEMTVFMGSFQKADAFSRVMTIVAALSIVVTAVYILRAIGRTVLGPIRNEQYSSLPDGTWNERVASVVLIGAITIMGIAPFWLVKLVTPGIEFIMNSVIK